MNLGELKVTERTPHQGRRDPTYRAEVALAPGPHALGETGAGTYEDVFARSWALIWPDGGALALYRLTAGVWSEADAGAALPMLPSTARHIGLAFDQSAFPVVCWEVAGEVYVRQWDAAGQVYVSRGPFAGTDPVVWMDATASRWIPDSDVLLVYLSPARTALVCRVQRDNYATEYPLLDGLTDGVLDQIVTLPGQGQLLGESAGQEAVWMLAWYPFYLPLTGTPDALTSGLGPLEGGAFEIVVVAPAETSDAMSAGFSGLSGGEMADINLTTTVQDHATQAAFTGLLSGSLVLAVMTNTQGTHAAQAAFTGLQSGNLTLVVIAVTQGAHAMSAGFSGLSGGSWNA